MNDPRENLPSASGFGADVACPGRRNLIRELGDDLYMESDDPAQAERGTRIHKALETNSALALQAEDEIRDFETAHEFESKCRDDWAQGLTGEFKHHREQRLWLHRDLDAALSGQPDIVTVCGSSALGLDYKTGFASHVPASERSWQLRVLAVLIWRNYGATTVRVGFVKPKSYDKLDCTDYSLSDLRVAEAQIFYHLEQSNHPEAPRSAGSHCRYCPARHRCPEAAAYSMLPVVVANQSQGTKRADLEMAVQRLTPADWKYIWQRGAMAKNIINAASDCLKKLSESDLKDLGIEVTPGKKLDPIAATGLAYDILKSNPALSASEILSCAEFSKGKLVDLLKSKLMLSEKDAKAWIDTNLDTAIERKRSEPGLKES